jgi:hypothetical protein
MSDPLYGLIGAEYLQNDPATVYENWECHVEPEDRPERLVIEEWSSEPLGKKLPDSWSVIEHIIENASDDLGFEDAYEALHNAGENPEVVVAFDAALKLWASKMEHGWRYGDTLLRELVITWDESGEPLIDGEPLYRKVEKQV